MDDDNYQQQQDEICALEAIYADKFVKWVQTVYNKVDYLTILLNYSFLTIKDVQIWNWPSITETLILHWYILPLTFMLNGYQMSKSSVLENLW